VSFGGTVKLRKGSSSVGPCVVCMGTGRSNLVDSSFNVLDVRHVQNSSLGSLLTDCIWTVQVYDSNSLSLRRSID